MRNTNMTLIDAIRLSSILVAVVSALAVSAICASAVRASGLHGAHGREAPMLARARQLPGHGGPPAMGHHRPPRHHAMPTRAAPPSPANRRFTKGTSSRS